MTLKASPRNSLTSNSKMLVIVVNALSDNPKMVDTAVTSIFRIPENGCDRGKCTLR